MVCPNCHTEFADESKFCTVCGSALEQIPAPEEPPVIAPEVVAPAEEAPTEVLESAEPPAEVEEPAVSEPAEPIPEPVAQKPKKKKAGLLFGILAAVVAVVVLIFGAFKLVGGFGGNGPTTKIARATAKTLGSESFTVDFTIETIEDGDDVYTVTATLQVAVDYKNKTVMAYGEAESSDDEVSQIAIYDGYLINAYEDGTYYYTDISEEINEFFLGVEKGEQVTKEFNKRKPDYKKIVGILTGHESDYEEAEEYIEFEELKPSAKALIKQLNKKQWLKDELGYSTKQKGLMKVHTFEVDSLDFLEDLIPLVKPAFADKDTYSDLEDVVEEAADDLNSDFYVEASFGIRSNKLRMCEVLIQPYEDEEVYMHCEFSKLGRTKLDEEKLAKMLKKAKDSEDDYDSGYYEEDYYEDDYTYGLEDYDVTSGF